MRVDQSSFHVSYRLRDQLRLPIKVCEMLDYEEAVIKNIIEPKKRRLFPICCSSNKKQRYFIDEQFIDTFSRMNTDEKIFHYCKSIDFLKQLSQGQLESRIFIQQTTFDNVLVQGGYFGMRWDQNTLKLNPQLGTIEIVGKNDSLIDCHQYLIRTSSNNEKNGFSLQAIKPGFTQVFKFRISNSTVFQNCFRSISLLVDKCIFENFRKEIQGMKDFRLNLNGDQQKPTVFINRQHTSQVQQIDNLLTSYIQQQIKHSCVSWGELSLNEIKDKYTIAQSTSFKPGKLFPQNMNEQQLYDEMKYQSSSQYSQCLHQLKSDPLIFRINKVYEFPLQQIVNCFSDAQYFQKWNNQVKTATITSLIKGQNSIIINQIHKPLVKYYEARIFTYCRTLFSKGTSVYIVDRPLLCTYNQQFQHFVKGEFVFAVWKLIRKGPDKTIIDGIVKLNYKMIKNLDVEIKLTGLYLEGFLNLDNYLNEQNIRNTNIFDLKFTDKNFKKLTQVIYKDQDHKQNNKVQLFQASANPKIDNQTRKLPFKFEEDSSFYSAQGPSDWNSKVLFSSKHSDFKDSKKQILTIPKSSKLLPDIVPIVQIPSANNTNSFSSMSQTTPILSKQKHPSSILMKPAKVSFSNKVTTNYNNQTNLFPIHKIYNNNQGMVAQNQSSKKIKQQSISPSSSFVPVLKPLIKINSNKEPSDQEKYKAHIVFQVSVKTGIDGECIINQNYITQPFPYPILPQPNTPYSKMTGLTWNHYLLKDLWTILPNGQLKCTNTQVLKSQNGVFSSIIKRAAANIIAGKGLNMSLPVQVFSELSVLQLIARGMCFAPLFLEKATKISDPIERLKLSTCFSLGFSLAYLQMAKPFNPILGQTYQCWINGCPYYAQQISHHPPISSFLFFGRGYKVYGNIIPEIDLSMNSGVGYNTGDCIVEFDQFPNFKIFLRSPGGQIQGLAYGDRKFNFTNKGIYFDNQGNYCQVVFNPSKKSMFSFGKQSKQVDSLQGNIYTVNPKQIHEFRKKVTRQGLNKKLLINPICSVEGRYTQQVLFNKKLYFHILNNEPSSYDQEAFPLASNCNYRQDIHYRRKNQLDRAQHQKQRLQQLQRRDKKLRQAKY